MINELPKKYHLIREDYFGKTFEGNETNKLLKHIGELTSLIPENVQIFIDTFESLDEVKKACFGFVLDDDHKVKTRKMEENWKILYSEFYVDITNKCHVIFDHVEQFIDRFKRPLGEFREQVVEAAHQKINQLWEWYCVKDVESEKHGKFF